MEPKRDHDAAEDCMTADGLRLIVRQTSVSAAEAIRPSSLTRTISDFRAAREIRRSSKVRRAGAGGSQIDLSRKVDISLFYIDFDVHRRRRGMIDPYFNTKAIKTHYRLVMQRTSDKLLTGLSIENEARLDRIAFLCAVAVTAEIIGLDHGDLQELSGRIKATVSPGDTSRPTEDFAAEAVRLFHETDVMPEVDARRQQRGDNVRPVRDSTGRRGPHTQHRGAWPQHSCLDIPEPLGESAAPAPVRAITAPSGIVWHWHDPEADDRIVGSAVDFCRVVTHTRNVADKGTTARARTTIAQCFAGPTHDSPALDRRITIGEAV